MRTSLQLGLLIIGAVGFLAACSSSEECVPGDSTCGTTPPLGGAGGQVGGGGTGPTGGTGGTGPVGGAGGAGGTGGGSTVNLGTALTLTAATGTPTSLPFTIAGPDYGIQGASFLDRSAQGNTFEVVPNADPTKLCVRGNLEPVPDTMSYGTHWGVDFGFNLNQATTPTTPPEGEGDAGAADAGTTGGGGGELPPLPWNPPANVIGFSFVVEGPTIDLIRVRVRPSGLDPMLETSIFCKSVNRGSAVSGQPTNVLFTEVTQQCWTPGLPAASREAGFDRLSWNLPADVNVPARPFDFCISNIKPILAP